MSMMSKLLRCHLAAPCLEFDRGEHNNRLFATVKKAATGTHHQFDCRAIWQTLYERIQDINAAADD